jgi:glyoxylase-like metal-dependent hydrolase (beta-lactamase superfamily II)/ferredoxin
MPLGAASGRRRVSVAQSMAENQRATSHRPRNRCCAVSPASVSMTSSTRIRRAENVPGDVFVDNTCIDCDACRWLAPETFTRAGQQSAVHAQPFTPEARTRALAAAAACPTGSIRTEKPAPEARDGQNMFPLAMNEATSVFYLGFTNRATFAGSSYLCVAEGVTVMVDLPRFNSKLANRIESISTPDYILLTHRDDVADHDKWAARYPHAKRVIHETECNERQRTNACEVKLRLGDPDQPDRIQLVRSVVIVHVPGHTRGSLALLDEASQSLFTGDTLFFSPGRNALGGTPFFISHSWKVQQESIAKLADEPFLTIYPAHGRIHKFETPEERHNGIWDAVQQMSTLSSRCP